VPGRSLKEAAREASRHTEKEMILKQLERTHWNRKKTARELQISYKALLYKLKQLGLDGSEPPRQ
jgi:two-component system response regulator AtoC